MTMRWLFEGFAMPSDADLKKIKAAGFETLILGLNDEDDPNRDGHEQRANRPDPSDLTDIFRFRHKNARDRYLRIMDTAQNLDLGIALMPWCRTTKAYNESAAEAVLPLTDHPSCVGVVHDTERFWHKLLPPGMNHEQAVAEHWVPCWAEKGVSNYVTDYAYMPKSVKPLLPHMCGALPQALSRSSWIPRGDVYRAGRTQKAAHASWSKHLEDDQLLIIEIAAYDQSKHPEGVRGALNKQASTASDLADGFAWWSYRACPKSWWKHLVEINLRHGA